MYEANELKKLAYYKTQKLGYIDIHKIQRIYDIYNIMGLVNNNIDLTKFIFYNDKYKVNNLTDEEIEYLKNNPVLKVHNELNWKPFNFNEDGVAKGYSIDYMNLLAKKLNIKVEYIYGYSWKQFLEQIKDNSLDVMLNIISTQDREKYISFTKPYKTFYHKI